MMMTRRGLMVAACAWAALLSTASLSAQGERLFKRYTAAQVVAGSGISSEIVLLNSSSTTCQFGLFAHSGAGELNPDVSLGGQTGGFATGVVGRHASMTIGVESPEDFRGAVTADLFTPECFNAFTMQIQYRLRDQAGRLSELFSTPTGGSLKPGQCALAAANVDLDGSDGTTAVPGFAAVSVAEIQNAQLCHTLKNAQGQPVTQEVCRPTDGTQQAMLLTEIFEDGFESGDTSSWQVCLEAPSSTPSAQSPTRVDPLFIDVVTDQGVTQFDGNEHQVKRPGCTEDQFNLCLDDRFRVSVDFRESPSAPPQPARVGGALPDQSGYFFFDNPDNLQMVVDLIDGCVVNNHFWVFYAATTNVEYTLRVEDTQSGQTREFVQPPGAPFAAVTDTTAFATCP